jgi:hypothetical protein
VVEGAAEADLGESVEPVPTNLMKRVACTCSQPIDLRVREACREAGLSERCAYCLTEHFRRAKLNRALASALAARQSASGLFHLNEYVNRNGWRGTVGAIGNIAGERYYWLVGADRSVSMVPHSALEVETEAA